MASILTKKIHSFKTIKVAYKHGNRREEERILVPHCYHYHVKDMNDNLNYVLIHEMNILLHPFLGNQI